MNRMNRGDFYPLARKILITFNRKYHLSATLPLGQSHSLVKQLTIDMFFRVWQEHLAPLNQ